MEMHSCLEKPLSFQYRVSGNPCSLGESMPLETILTNLLHKHKSGGIIGKPQRAIFVEKRTQLF